MRYNVSAFIPQCRNYSATLAYRMLQAKLNPIVKDPIDPRYTDVVAAAG